MNKKEQTISALRLILKKVEEANEAELMQVERIAAIQERPMLPELDRMELSAIPGRETITITVRINGGGDDGL